MGNRLCKDKGGEGGAPPPPAAAPPPPKGGQQPFGRIFSRLRLRPTSWKSESHLNQKQVNRIEVSPKSPPDETDNFIKTQPLSKSSDWTDVSLEVPEEHIHLRNPKLSLIFNDNSTPTPPPRKHKKNFRERIEAVAKSGLQALQMKKPVEEPLFVKKKINYDCPLCDSDEKNHNRDHHHNHNHHNAKNEEKHQKKEDKRKKNLSVISLPNYNELKLTVANFEDIDKPRRPSSTASLNNSPKKLSISSTGKLDSYITRCRSFGSLLPQQLKKLKTQKAPTDIESDDSFGGLEDWDLGLIEHYNPKEASLPRPRKIQKIDKEKDILADIESLVVKEEDIEKTIKPVPPVRRSESLLKKINKEASETAHKTTKDAQNEELRNSTKSVTPPPSPIPQKEEKPMLLKNLPVEENGKVEHSGLMKILQEFSIKDAQRNSLEEETPPVFEDITKISSEYSSLTPSLKDFEKSLGNNQIEDFINAEKCNTHLNNANKYNNSPVVS